MSPSTPSVSASASASASAILPSSPAPSPSAAETSATHAPGPVVLDYTHLHKGLGAQLSGPADVRQLKGAPEDFKTFIGGVAAQLAAEGKSECPTAFSGVTVTKVSTAGFATGGVSSCGGYVALWAKVDGSWKEAIGTQEQWDCAELTRYRVPSALVGHTCYSYVDQKERLYDQA